MYTFTQLSRLVQGKIIQFDAEQSVEQLLSDSRKLIIHPTSIYFAIKGERNDGHDYLEDTYKKGIRQFVIDDESRWKHEWTGCNVLLVQSVLFAIQEMAKFHRESFSLPVLAITGSNAKTIIKEWLCQMLVNHYQIVKSPKSYNSQLGVPLSVWQIKDYHNLGIFEAGISKKGEMARLQEIIKPTIGLFTNVGSAHDEGFETQLQKVEEKLRLFKNCNTIIYCADHQLIDQVIKQQLLFNTFAWSTKGNKAFVQYTLTSITNVTKVEAIYKYQSFKFELPLTDAASIENLLHCICFMLFMGFDNSKINQSLRVIKNIPMRLELKQGINNCYIIDDTYNNDLGGLQIAMEFLENQKLRSKKTLILSDVLEAGSNKEILYSQIGRLIVQKGISQLIAIGIEIQRFAHRLPINTKFYASVGDFMKDFDQLIFKDELILVKGARVFRFEEIVQKLQRKIHSTRLEINLDALMHNLNYYKSKLKGGTKIMAMVKSFAYGSGSFEVANLLQFHKVDYLGVAYTDEAVDLRAAGIHMPIMVMNPTLDSFDALVKHYLEPEMYNFQLLKALNDYAIAHKVKFKIHLAIDTGMRRLGFEVDQLQDLVQFFNEFDRLEIVSVFSHLVGADEEIHNQFSKHQIAVFEQFCEDLSAKTNRTFLKHICNSAGIVRFPEAHYEMVRLGIGLYGVEATAAEQTSLRPVSSLKTIISQIKYITANETVGYSRKGHVQADAKIATIAIGYGDGYSRRFSNGVGKVLVAGKLTPILGNVCMDMCMIDVTNVDVQEGDEVIVFGAEPTIIELAQAIDTIPYEILTGISERVKRIFFVE